MLSVEAPTASRQADLAYSDGSYWDNHYLHDGDDIPFERPIAPNKADRNLALGALAACPVLLDREAYASFQPGEVFRASQWPEGTVVFYEEEQLKYNPPTQNFNALTPADSLVPEPFVGLLDRREYLHRQDAHKRGDRDTSVETVQYYYDDTAGLLYSRHLLWGVIRHAREAAILELPAHLVARHSHGGKPGARSLDICQAERPNLALGTVHHELFLRNVGHRVLPDERLLRFTQLSVYFNPGEAQPQIAA